MSHTAPPITDESPDFSLVLGGPIFQMLRRSRLSGDSLELLHRRIAAIVLIAWVPLLVLSLVGNYFLGGTAKLSFLHDIEAHVRLLVALPVLIAAELIVHLRIRPKVKTSCRATLSGSRTSRNFSPPSNRRCDCATRCR
jgi:uncharacterized membrane protein YbhN (UPF0104 family)